ncbi:Rho guanyl-nucleotide exchange factor activity protein, partial [Halocaridina rubra]
SYEWALEAMKVVGRVKSEGLASPDQVGAAARALTTYLEEHPPISQDTFTTMINLATNLNNNTLLQQCKMAQVRCQETNELLRSRQALLQKAKRQMEFDCQSFVDLEEVLGGSEDMSPLAWLACSPLNASGRRRSVSSIGSRPRESLSRCPSLDTDDDSVFLDPSPPPPPSKIPLEGRTSLGGIKEVRESDEDLQQPSSLSPSSSQKIKAATSRLVASSSGSSGTSGTSSCASSDSSGPITINNKYMKRSSTWQYGIMPKEQADENSGLDDGVPLSPTSAKSIPSFSVNSHLLIRGSQLNLTLNTDELSQEEVKKSKTLHMIMRELIQTERDYVSSLEYIIENYIPELMREDIPQALRGQRNVIFGNLEKIYEFHSGYFLHALEACEMRPFSVGSIFLRYESQFYLYALYNKNKPKSDSLMSEYGSAFFRGMQLELEDRMDLASYLLKPVQRMGKYALILKQLLKECSRGDEHYDDLMRAQEMVQFQLRHGNDLLAMDSLRDCDVNLKEQGRLLRQGEFVVWEGSRARKSVRHVFLFEDLILFSKGRRDPEKKTLDIFQYKHSMKMTDIGLTEQVGESSTKFEIWFRKRKPSDTYLLQAPNSEVKEGWTEEISKLLWRQALRNRTMRLHEMSSMGIGNKPCLDIRPSEDQISDRSISINQLNKVPRLRSGSITTIGECSGIAKRPHSIISVSSSSTSSSSTSSSHSSNVCPTYVGTLNLGFEPGDSPRALHRSVTRTSQCSAESGILADMYSGADEDAQSHRRIERSNSTVTTVSVDSALSPVSSTSPLTPTSFSNPSPHSTAVALDSLSRMSNGKPSVAVYETPPSQPSQKEPSTKTLLTTEV